MKRIISNLILSVIAFSIVNAATDETNIIQSEMLSRISNDSDRPIAEELLKRVYSECNRLLPLYDKKDITKSEKVSLQLWKPTIEQDLQKLKQLFGDPVVAFTPEAKDVVSKYMDRARIRLNGHLTVDYQSHVPAVQEPQKITMFQRPYADYIEKFCKAVLMLRKVDDPECFWPDRIKKLVKQRAQQHATSYSKALIKKYESFDRFDYKFRVSQETYYDSKDLLEEFQNGTTASELPYDSSHDRPSMFGGFIQPTGDNAIVLNNGFESRGLLDSVLQKFRDDTKVTDDDRLVLIFLRGRDFEYQYVKDVKGMYLFSNPKIQTSSRNGKTVNPRILLHDTGKKYSKGDKIDFKYLSIDQFYDMDGKGDLVPVFYGETIQQ